MNGLDLLMNTKKTKKINHNTLDKVNDQKQILEKKINLKLEIKNEITELFHDILSIQNKKDTDFMDKGIEEINSMIENQIENLIELLKFKYQYIENLKEVT